MIVDSIASRSSILPEVDGSNISNTDIEFYKIWLYSGTSDTEAVNKVSTDVDPEINTTADGCSGYQPRENASYTLSNIESGLYWVARVRAYADISPADESSSGLVMVAEAVSNAQAVFGNDDSISVSLNELGTSDSSIGQVEKAGEITITLKLPNGSDGASITCNAIPLSGKAAGEIFVPVFDTVMLSNENTFTFTISEDTFEQGNYLLTVSIEKKNDDGTTVYLARSGSVLMKLLPGLSASGTIDLDYDVSLSPGLGIEDSLGSEIKFDVTELSWNDTNDNGVFTFQLEEEKSEDISYGLYIDDILKASGTITTKGPHTLEISELSPGKHTVVFILRNENEANSIGSYIYILNVSYDSNTDITVE